eukprot:CAMPEP_0180753784 /NCGR_PEP_ID=MMETSP1038_2-20121128/32853_1 /TAXON_ID=632150 /ORGANISM="Azadinium spinosum, Strain 3D9" /LENGTH=99 /DNA_ID=CAMNT_0022787665 /DNA_START=9 /DNA_END=304 /DNA_ORIENTATION=-
MAGVGATVQLAHKFITSPQASTKGFCNVIKLGTFCRTIVWPCLAPLMMYQYIRKKDEDYYATDLFYYMSGSTDTKSFYDNKRVGISGHWKLQQDMETIR